MLCKTFKTLLWIVLGLTLQGSGASAKAGTNRAEVTVSVFNDAKVPEATLRTAENVAKDVFVRADVPIRWLHCGRLGETAYEGHSCSQAEYPLHLHVRIVAGRLNHRESTLGLTYLNDDGSGCQADISYQGVAEVALESQVNLGIVLGNAIAHELGHLLLGTNSHSPEGIMRAHWSTAELAAAIRGQLLFTDRQRNQIKQKLDGQSLVLRAGLAVAR